MLDDEKSTRNSARSMYRRMMMCCGGVGRNRKKSSSGQDQQKKQQNNNTPSNKNNVFFFDDNDGQKTVSEQVEKYLLSNRQFLNEFVAKHVPKHTLIKWIEQMDMTGDGGAKMRLSSVSSNTPLTDVAMLHAATEMNALPADDVASRLQTIRIDDEWILSSGGSDKEKKIRFLEEMTNLLMHTLGWDGFRIYVYDDRDQCLRLETTKFLVKNVDDERCTDGKDACLILNENGYMCQTCASTQKPLSSTFSDNEMHKQVFLCPQGIDQIICQPWITNSVDEQLVAVSELYKIDNLATVDATNVKDAFDVKVTATSRRLSDFLLSVTKSIFKDMKDIDIVLMKILNFAKKLVNAERASLFLVDFETEELYAKFFDLGGEDDDENADLVDSKAVSDPSNIRFPLCKGIAGHVAMTGQAVNLDDAYLDERFNRKVDESTGYRTKSLLCMPIWNDDRIIGVMELINKRKGKFTKTDEKAFAIFAIYCGLAINHTQLYENKTLSEQRLKVALEVLTYHASYRQSEYDQYLKMNHGAENGFNHELDQMQRFDFDPWDVPENHKPICVELMLFDLLPESIRCDRETLIKFILTVRRNYRQIPYHNWNHAFSVANTIYCLIKNLKIYKLTNEEVLALFIASLCHDLDHMGKTNSFMVKSGTALGALYSMSTMENHHFNRAVAILQRDECNIFKNLDSLQYKAILSKVKHCILSTDLELHFKHYKKLKQANEQNTLNFEENDEHRLLFMSLLITTADLNVNYKPILQQQKVLKKMMKEFYAQGDEETTRGNPIVPMLDRSKQYMIPQLQLGFLRSVCLPCFQLVSDIVPEFEPTLIGAQNVIRHWEKLCEKENFCLEMM